MVEPEKKDPEVKDAQTDQTDASTGASAAGGAAGGGDKKLLLDEETGEMVSKK